MHVVWTRLKGLMVYPLIVVIVSLGLTLLLSVSFGRFMETMSHTNGIFTEGWRPQSPNASFLLAAMWIPPVVMIVLALLAIGAVLLPAWRARLRWRLPAFREASLAQLASAVALMLKNGTTLAESLALAEGIEAKTPAAPALAEWRRLTESGQGKPSQWPAIKPLPPLFVWLVRTGGEDVAAGFAKAAEIYQSRAAYRTEMALYGALPVSILLLGQMVLWQVLPMFRTLTWFMQLMSPY